MPAIALVPKIQTKQGVPVSATANESFRNSFYASMLSSDPLYKDFYYNKLIEQPTSLERFLNTYTSYDTFRSSSFTNVEFNPYYSQVKITNASAAVPAFSAGTNTVAIPIAASSQLLGAYIIPQVGNIVFAPPYGVPLVVTAVTPGGGSPSMTVRHASSAGTAFTIPANSEMPVTAGSLIGDCVAPSALWRLQDAGIEQTLTMKNIAAATQEICGDALVEQLVNTKYQWQGDDGTEYEMWWNLPLKRMMQDHVADTLHLRLLDHDWGLIPTLMSRGSIFTTAATTEVTVDDFYALKQALSSSGVGCKDFMMVCGTAMYILMQKLANAEGVDKISYAMFPETESFKWLNLNFGKISVGGLNITFMEEPWMSQSTSFGAAGYNFNKSAILIPLCDRTWDIKANERDGSGSQASKMLRTTYFEDRDGMVWDKWFDGVGEYSDKKFPVAGIKKQQWTVQSRFTQTVYQPQSWVLMNFL